jgi:hypothetical protein
MRRINFFSFVKEDGVGQEAIKAGGREMEDTLVTCNPGDAMCVFTTKLHDAFFDNNGNVTGFGEAILEFEDTGGGRSLLRRRTQVDMDIKFAGAWDLKILFMVESSSASTNSDTPNETPVDWWNNLDPLVRYLLMALVLLALIAFVCCLAYCLFWLYTRESDEDEYMDDKLPREVDVDSQASFFKNFHKDVETSNSVSSGSESELGNEYVDEWDGPMGDGLGGLPEVIEEEEYVERRPPNTIHLRDRPPIPMANPAYQPPPRQQSIPPNPRPSQASQAPPLPSNVQNSPPNRRESQASQPNKQPPRTSNARVPVQKHPSRASEASQAPPRTSNVESNAPQQRANEPSQPPHRSSDVQKHPPRRSQQPAPAPRRENSVQKHPPRASQSTPAPRRESNAQKHPPRTSQSTPAPRRESKVQKHPPRTSQQTGPAPSRGSSDVPIFKGAPVKKQDSDLKKNPGSKEENIGDSKHEARNAGDDKPNADSSHVPRFKGVPKKKQSPVSKKKNKVSIENIKEEQGSVPKKNGSPVLRRKKPFKVEEYNTEEDDSDWERNLSGEETADTTESPESSQKSSSKHTIRSDASESTECSLDGTARSMATDNMTRSSGESKASDEKTDGLRPSDDVGDAPSDEEKSREESDSDGEDSMNFYPDDFDVAFDNPNHVGTMVYEMVIKTVAASNKGARFSSKAGVAIANQLKGRRYFTEDKIGNLEFWREATPEETNERVKKFYNASR